jgi:hypothetical protein
VVIKSLYVRKFSEVKIAESRNQHMYSDRRKLGRTVVHQRAKLLLPNFDSPQDCFVRHLTIMGACIEFDANRIGRVHKKFELSFDIRYRLVVPCHLAIPRISGCVVDLCFS